MVKQGIWSISLGARKVVYVVVRGVFNSRQKFTKMDGVAPRHFVRAWKTFSPLPRRVSRTITPRIECYAGIIIVKRFDLVLRNFERFRDLLTDRLEQSFVNFWKRCKEVSRLNRFQTRVLIWSNTKRSWKSWTECVSTRKLDTIFMCIE